MSNEESTEGATSSEDPKPTKCTEEEALTSLEDHRCAICNNVLINASRIDCGHTFCRHCLNIHCESRNERGKPTCFICDAAVTEISQNAERDKDIDKLYSSLPVDNQLRRAREKAERKKEEESFASRPKGEQRHVNSTQTSNDSFGRGDELSYDDDHAEGAQASWTEHGAYDILRHDAQDPTYFCADTHSNPYAFSYWSGDQEEDPGHLHHHHHHHHHEFDFMSSNEEDDALNSDSDPPNSSLTCPHSSLHHPEPPVVIHHTVQHVFHTVHLRQGGTRNDDFGSNDMGNPQQEEYFDWNRRPEHCSRHRDHHPTSCFPQMPFPNFSSNCPYNNHSHSTGLLFAGPSHRECYGPFESPHHHYSSFTGNAFGHHRPVTAAYYGESDSLRYPMDAPSNPYSPFPREHDRDLYEAAEFNGDEGEGQEENGERPCTACENLCEFHRAMAEQGRRDIGSCSLAALRLGRPNDTDAIIDSELELGAVGNDHLYERMHIPRSRSETFGGMRLGRARRFQRPEIRRHRRSHLEHVSSSPPPDT